MLLHLLQLWISFEGAVLEDQRRRLPHVHPALRRHDVLLVFQWLPEEEGAALEDCSTVAEDEVDGAGDEAVSVELAVGVCVERVLVPFYVAIKEDHFIGARTQRHRLVLLRAGRVFEADVSGYEVIPMHGCGRKQLINN